MRRQGPRRGRVRAPRWALDRGISGGLWREGSAPRGRCSGGVRAVPPVTHGEDRGRTGSTGGGRPLPRLTSDERDARPGAGRRQTADAQGADVVSGGATAQVAPRTCRLPGSLEPTWCRGRPSGPCGRRAARFGPEGRAGRGARCAGEVARAGSRHARCGLSSAGDRTPPAAVAQPPLNVPRGEDRCPPEPRGALHNTWHRHAGRLGPRTDRRTRLDNPQPRDARPNAPARHRPTGRLGPRTARRTRRDPRATWRSPQRTSPNDSVAPGERTPGPATGRAATGPGPVRPEAPRDLAPVSSPS